MGWFLFLVLLVQLRHSTLEFDRCTWIQNVHIAGTHCRWGIEPKKSNYELAHSNHLILSLGLWTVATDWVVSISQIDVILRMILFHNEILDLELHHVPSGWVATDSLCWSSAWLAEHGQPVDDAIAHCSLHPQTLSMGWSFHWSRLWCELWRNLIDFCCRQCAAMCIVELAKPFTY